MSDREQDTLLVDERFSKAEFERRDHLARPFHGIVMFVKPVLPTERPPKIRMATTADAAAVARILRESFVEYEPLYTRDAFAATTPGEEGVRRRMEEGPLWIAACADVAQGTVSAVSR